MTDVLVVGGGPAGLAAALAARQKGFRVTVADLAWPPIDKACGEGLLPDGVAALESLGLPAGADAFPLRGIRFVESGASVGAQFPCGLGLGIRRTALHSLMVQAARDAGVSLLWGTRVAGITGGRVLAGDRAIGCDWIVGADGSNSRVRRWAGLDGATRSSKRYGFRRHYRITPWSGFMELHWGEGFQVYVTPVRADEVCVAIISADPRLRIDAALRRTPELWKRLERAELITSERGAVSASRRLRAVARGKVALVGDASGSVDAITGEGLCLAFSQALALGDALEAGDLSLYQTAHRKLARHRERMAAAMLAIGDRRWLRSRVLQAFRSSPDVFRDCLAMHVGALSPVGCVKASLGLGLRVLAA